MNTTRARSSDGSGAGLMGEGLDGASGIGSDRALPRTHAETLGQYLKRHREARGINASELSRTTRISSGSIEAIECDRFDELPGEVFVRGFLKAYAQAIGLLPAEVLARYTSSRRVVFVTPLPMQTPLQAARDEHGRRFGVAIAFVLLLILLSLALSIALRPRGRDMPSVLSQRSSSPALDARTMPV